MNPLHVFDPEADWQQSEERFKLFKNYNFSCSPEIPQNMGESRITYAPQTIFLATETRQLPASMDDPDDLGFCEHNLVLGPADLTCDNEYRMWLANRDRCDDGFHEFDPNCLCVVRALAFQLLKVNNSDLVKRIAVSYSKDL